VLIAEIDPPYPGVTISPKLLAPFGGLDLPDFVVALEAVDAFGRTI